MSNDVAVALFDRIKGVKWESVEIGGQRTFAESSRRLKLYADAQSKPALYLVEHRETVSQSTRQRPISVRAFTVVIYHDAAMNNPECVPADETHAIVEAIKDALRPNGLDSGFPDQNTLGDLVHYCKIDGPILKESGDLGEEAMIIIPVAVMMP